MAQNGKFNLSATLRMLATGIAILIIFLIYRSKGSLLLAELSSFRFAAVLPAAAITVCTLLISAMRWHTLANLINIRLSRYEAISLTMQGNFFSLITPGGAVGGDVVKMAALSRHLRSGERTEGIFSILMDRIIGMAGLFAAGLFLLFSCRYLFTDLIIPGFEKYHNPGIMLWWGFFILCCAGLSAAAAFSMYRKIKNLPVINLLFSFADRKLSGKISRIVSACDLYADKRRTLTVWLMITLFVIHLAPAISMIFLLMGCGMSDHAVFSAIPAVIIGNIAGIIPFFPGGIGARDAVTIALLTAGGCPLEIAAAGQLLATCLLIIFNLSGALFFIFDRKNPESAQ